MPSAPRSTRSWGLGTERHQCRRRQVDHHRITMIPIFVGEARLRARHEAGGYPALRKIWAVEMDLGHRWQPPHLERSGGSRSSNTMSWRCNTKVLSPPQGQRPRGAVPRVQ